MLHDRCHCYKNIKIDETFEKLELSYKELLRKLTYTISNISHAARQRHVGSKKCGQNKSCGLRHVGFVFVLQKDL